MTSVVQNPRKTLLVGLAHDLASAGWDQPCKMYFVLGEDGDEYVEYIGSFNMDPAHWLMHRAEEGTLREHVRGIIVTWESYTYPKELQKALRTHSQAAAGYRALVGPSEHPAHVELRTLCMVMRDGAVLRAEHYTDNLDEPRTHQMDPRPIPGQQTGDSCVDFMRAMLGLASNEQRPHSLAQAIALNPELQKLMFQGQTEGWSPEVMGVALFRGVGPEVQVEMLDSMPDEVRQKLTEEGFDFDSLAQPTFEEVTDDGEQATGQPASDPGLPPG